MPSVPATRNASTADAPFAKAYSDLLVTYRDLGAPVEVNFRKLVSSIPYNSDRLSHQVHTYPAKLLVHIPHFFLNAGILEPGASVIDPFCGTGTVLVEAMASGFTAFGADSNPLARLITRVKTRPVNPGTVNRHLKLLASGFRSLAATIPDVVNIDYWFAPRIQRELGTILTYIKDIEDFELREFFQVTFSSILRQVSQTDLRIAVPVRLRPDKYPDGHRLRMSAEKRLASLHDVNILDLFDLTARRLAHKLARLQEVPGRVGHIFHDARELGSHIPMYNAVLTSPPYAGAQKYVRSSSLSLGWLGMCNSSQLKSLEDQSIGREHLPKASCRAFKVTGYEAADVILENVHKLNPLRASIFATYITEMREALTAALSRVHSDGLLIMVTGNNSICGRPFPTTAILKQMATSLGAIPLLELRDDIRSRGLMTKRNTTAGTISCESISLFTKK